MLDAIAQWRRLALLHPLEGIEHHVVAEVSDRMDADLEAFAVCLLHEAVELLRTIIKLQEDLHDKTKERHKDEIRKLLED